VFSSFWKAAQTWAAFSVCRSNLLIFDQVEKKALTIAIISLVAGIAIGFLSANGFNRSELDALRSENARLKAGAETAGDQEPRLSDEEIQSRIRKADENPSDLEYQKNLGVALYRYAAMKKDVPLLMESMRLLKRVLVSDPGNFDINVALGNAYFDIAYFGQDSPAFATARQYYETALKSKPADSPVRTDYGLTYFLQDPPDNERAVSEFSMALKSDPKNERTLEFAVQAYIKLHDQANAKKTLESLRSANSANASIPELATAVSAIAETSK
jgi:tetratricopeptide (TPR) repeat protein